MAGQGRAPGHVVVVREDARTQQYQGASMRSTVEQVALADRGESHGPALVATLEGLPAACADHHGHGGGPPGPAAGSVMDAARG